ncbi:MAG: DUF1801 domain-containing protein [Alphaproteobacteria bacterium]|nr:DUF1801 domain-containing protein [Alphaproteobacteria bacterium]
MPVAFKDTAVQAVFDRYEAGARDKLLYLRDLIFDQAASIQSVGPLTESLKWGQPAYRPSADGIGTTVRLDAVRGSGRAVALYVPCSTPLISDFITYYPNLFNFQGKRALVFAPDEAIPEAELRHCIAMALTYHNRRRNTV